MPDPKPKVAVLDDESTTGLIEAICEITADTAEAPLSGPHVEELERRLKTEDAKS